MDKLHQIFMTEACELIADLEKALLTFENDLKNMNSVREIFRVMHTLKGSASMFGFENVSALTHDLESIYDNIREGKIDASTKILDITLQSVDHLKSLLADPSMIEEATKRVHGALLEDLKGAFDKAEPAIATDEVREESGTYYLYFKPSEDAFKTGTNPLYLIEELASMGTIVVLPNLNGIPSLEEINPVNSYCSFELVLHTSRTMDQLREVFIFVEDRCEITIEKLASLDLLSDITFRQSLSEMSHNNARTIGAKAILTLAAASHGLKDQETRSTVKNDINSHSIRVSSEKLDELMNLVSELVTSQARLSLLAGESNLGELANLSENMEKITRRLRDTTFNICLVPLETLVVRFQRLVRDLSRELGKEIEFVTEGTDTELDKSIIEHVSDPILHIIRNCIDHGIESPAERVTSGKEERGKVVFKAYHSGTSVYIRISDNGRGLDEEKIRRKAVAKGLISSDVVLTQKEISDLVFSSGFSTADKITDVSGRGVGMDIVKRNIEAIHGEVFLETKQGEGTSITIRLPLTLSIMDGMLVQVGGSRYILPLSSIEKCYELQTKFIEDSVVQKQIFDGALLPVFNLHHVFNEQVNNEGIVQVIKIMYEEFPVAITVDRVIGECQAVMKPLGAFYSRQDEFSGATILGDGTVALVIDTTRMLKKLVASSQATAA